MLDPVFEVPPENQVERLQSDVFFPLDQQAMRKIDPNPVNVGTLARAWREYLGLTQKEVAGRMGITQAALSQMEAGEKRLRKTTLEKLAAAMGIGTEQL